MTSSTGPGPRILGILQSAAGKGIVHIEDRFETDIDDLWSALTEPGRLARWYGQVEGNLRPAENSAHASLPADGKAPGAWTHASRHGGAPARLGKIGHVNGLKLAGVEVGHKQGPPALLHRHLPRESTGWQIAEQCGPTLKGIRYVHHGEAGGCTRVGEPV